MRRWTFARLLILTVVLPAASPRASGQTRPEAATTQFAAVAGKVIPEVNFQGIPLDDALDFIRDISGANIVISRDPGVPDRYPTNVNMRLKNVTVRQFLQLLP